MRVENENDRQEMPEECDWCGTSNVKLKRFYHYGPWHNVNWLCCYCSGGDFVNGENHIVNSFAAMLNILEKRLNPGRKNITM